jgi:AcrR family transcriptional regulator
VRQPYHHGNLREALVEASIDLVREGGPGAIVLREAARRVGVSPNAAYRHFAALPDLVCAVAERARADLSESMKAEAKRRRHVDNPRADALELLRAVGRGYILFALRDPGMFAVAFPFAKTTVGPPPEDTGNPTSPWAVLNEALDAMIAAGMLAIDDRGAAAAAAWAAVHGMSQLLLGPMAGIPPEARDALIETCLEVTGRGLTR